MVNPHQFGLGAYLSCVRLKVQEWCPLKLKFEKSLVKVHISKNDTVAQTVPSWVFKPCCTTWEIYWTPSESTLNFTELPGFVEVQIRVLPGPAEV